MLTLFLRSGVKFHDGTPFDAAVAKWNLERRMQPEVKSPSRQQSTEVIDAVEAPNATTLVLRLKSAAPSLLGLLGQREGFMISPAAAAKLGDDLAEPGRDRPIRIQVLDARPADRGRAQSGLLEPGKPYLDRVVFMLISNAALGIPRLVTREVDFVGALTPVDIRPLENRVASLCRRARQPLACPADARRPGAL